MELALPWYQALILGDRLANPARTAWGSSMPPRTSTQNPQSSNTKLGHC